jgi:hypothetical protein
MRGSQEVSRESACQLIHYLMANLIARGLQMYIRTSSKPPRLLFPYAKPPARHDPPRHEEQTLNGMPDIKSHRIVPNGLKASIQLYPALIACSYSKFQLVLKLEFALSRIFDSARL